MLFWFFPRQKWLITCYGPKFYVFMSSFEYFPHSSYIILMFLPRKCQFKPCPFNTIHGVYLHTHFLIKNRYIFLWFYAIFVLYFIGFLSIRNKFRFFFKIFCHHGMRMKKASIHIFYHTHWVILNRIFNI